VKRLFLLIALLLASPVAAQQFASGTIDDVAYLVQSITPSEYVDGMVVITSAKAGDA
jgi:hypothetical protein